MSSFMVADKIVVETKTEEGSPLLLEIENVSDFFIVQSGKQADTGTTVTLFLKKDFSFSLEKEIRQYSRHIEFPIEIKTDAMVSSVQIIDKGLDLAATNFFRQDQVSYPIIVNVMIFSLKIHNPQVQGVFGVLLRKNAETGVEPINRRYLGYFVRKELSELSKSGERIVVSNEGIFVGNINFLPPWLNVDYVFYDLNLKRFALDLNLARNGVVTQNMKYKQFAELIQEIMIALHSKILDTFKEKALDSGLDFVMLSRLYLEQYLNLDSDSLKKENISVKLRELLQKFCYIKCFSTEGICYMSVNDIGNSGKTATPLENLDWYDNEDIKQIVAGFPVSERIYLSTEEPFLNVAKLILPKNDFRREFAYFLKINRSNDLNGIIPKSWTLASFENYDAQRFIEISHWSETILNRKHKFIELLVRNKSFLTGSRKIALLGFFRSLKKDLKGDFPAVQDKQRDLLKLLVDLGRIKDEEIESYVLTAKDFPSHILKTS